MTIQLRKAAERGTGRYGWLEANYTFSFANYLDLNHMGFGPLRVLNQDRVAAGRGFPRHSHENMEIVSFVIEGVLEHEDSMGNGSQVRAGEVQYMSAGSGVTHSEYNASDDSTLELLQMWVVPTETETPPRYGQLESDPQKQTNQLWLVCSPDGEAGSLAIRQDAKLYVSKLEPGHSVKHAIQPGRCAWLHVARGEARVGEFSMQDGDGAGIVLEDSIEIASVREADLVLWDLPQPE